MGRTRWKEKKARDLVVGDYLKTAIGYSPVDKIAPDHDGILVRLDLRHERSTRSDVDGSLLWFWGPEKVRFLPGAEPPPLNAARQKAREEGLAFPGARTGQEPATGGT